MTRKFRYATLAALETQMDTITLIEQSRLGDQQAFARIVRQYQGMVSAATLNVVGNYAQSEDLAQETFLTAWKKLPELREPEKLASWLYGIARRVALRWLEQQQRDPLRNYAELNSTELDADAITDQQIQMEAEERHRREQSLALVWSTVKELPETLREPLLLYYRYSKSVADIAASLALTEEAVRQRLSRGRKMLKAEVEKHVENVLEATGPGEYFTVGVLASLSMLATAPEVFAATSAASSASAAAKSTGGVLCAGIGAYLQVLFSAVFFPLALFFGPIFGAWSGIRNSPTLRSRRFMLKAVIFQTMMLFSFLVFAIVLGNHCGLFLPLNNDDTMQNPRIVLWISLVFYGAICVSSYCVCSSYKINRRWRKIVEEDLTQPVDLDALERSSLSLRSLRRFLYCSLTMPLIAILLTVPITMAVIALWTTMHWWAIFEPVHYIQEIDIIAECGASIFFMSSIVIATTLIFSYVVGMKITDENSLTAWKPRIPNYLQVLTGEEEPKRGLRYRTHFWSDILLVGLGLCIIQGIACERYFNPWANPSTLHYYYPVFVISFIAFLLFAMFFAGIPRKRYFGYIYLGVFIAVLDTIFALFFDPWLLRDPPAVYGNLIVNLPWFSCFILSGVLGLYAFRKKV